MTGQKDDRRTLDFVNIGAMDEDADDGGEGYGIRVAITDPFADGRERPACRHELFG